MITRTKERLGSASGAGMFLPATLVKVLRAMEEADYRVELRAAIKASLAVAAALSLKGRDNCLVLVFEGGSGMGKSVIVRMLYPSTDAARAVLERVDDFTPASFVSHAANKTEAKLAKIDLLPRLRGKLMLTKELAPLFRGEERDLRQNFARLTAILDGEGYKSNSGTHGARGYEGKFIFNWIGATTPIPNRTHAVMAQLGNRILFYEVAGDEATEEQLVEFAQNHQPNAAMEKCRAAVNEFMEEHFREHPVESIDPDSIVISEALSRQIVRYAQLISHGRVEVTRDAIGKVVESEKPEGPHRVILLLQMFARGLALTDDRREVNAEDLKLVRHVAFSSLPRRRRDLLRVLLAAGGKMSTKEVASTLSVSTPTALSYMEELGQTDICRFTAGCQETSKPATVEISQSFGWLRANTPL